MGELQNSYKINFGVCTMPMASICIGNEIKWRDKGEMRINSITISSGVGSESSKCVVKLSKPFNNFKGKVFVPGNEFDVIKQGEAIKVYLGYGNPPLIMCNLAFKGFVSRAQIEYTKAIICITIECMDGKMWMMAGKEFKKILGNKYSTVVRSVLTPSYTKYIKSNQINILAEPTLTNPIFQSNESDYEFLCRIANITSSFFYVYLGKAYFVSPGSLRAFNTLISPGDCVKSISWGFDVLGVSQSVSVEGTNPKNPKIEVRSSQVISNIQNVGQGAPPSVLSPNIGSVTKEQMTDPMVNSIAEAQFVAQSRFTKSSLNFVKCIIEIKGYTSKTSEIDFFPGMHVVIKGFNYPVDNTYVLVGIEHRYSASKKGGREFKTILTLATDTCLKI